MSELRPLCLKMVKAIRNAPSNSDNGFIFKTACHYRANQFKNIRKAIVKTSNLQSLISNLKQKIIKKFLNDEYFSPQDVDMIFYNLESHSPDEIILLDKYSCKMKEPELNIYDGEIEENIFGVVRFMFNFIGFALNYSNKVSKYQENFKIYQEHQKYYNIYCNEGVKGLAETYYYAFKAFKIGKNLEIVIRIIGNKKIYSGWNLITEINEYQLITNSMMHIYWILKGSVKINQEKFDTIYSIMLSIRYSTKRIEGFHQIEEEYKEFLSKKYSQDLCIDNIANYCYCFFEAVVQSYLSPNNTQNEKPIKLYQTLIFPNIIEFDQYSNEYSYILDSKKTKELQEMLKKSKSSVLVFKKLYNAKQKMQIVIDQKKIELSPEDSCEFSNNEKNRVYGTFNLIIIFLACLIISLKEKSKIELMGSILIFMVFLIKIWFANTKYKLMKLDENIVYSEYKRLKMEYIEAKNREFIMFELEKIQEDDSSYFCIKIKGNETIGYKITPYSLE